MGLVALSFISCALGLLQQQQVQRAAGSARVRWQWQGGGVSAWMGGVHTLQVSPILFALSLPLHSFVLDIFLGMGTVCHLLTVCRFEALGAGGRFTSSYSVEMCMHFQSVSWVKWPYFMLVFL